MKRIFWFIGVILAVVGLLFGVKVGLDWQSSQQKSAARMTKNQDQTLTIFNWGDYIDPTLIHEFEQKTGYHVDYETFDSNEAMFTKIEQGGTRYDLAIPSDYMIQKMRAANLLEPLDYHELKDLQEYNPELMNQPFDPGNRYSLPYFWGTLGIVYNDQDVAADELKTWNDLWNPKWNQSVMLYDSARDVMGVGLASNDDDINSTNMSELLAAKGRLDALMPNVKAIVGDEIKMYMVQNEAKIAVDFSGDAQQMLAQNSHLHYVLPQGRGNMWFDNMVIPKTVRNKKAAYAFINFLADPTHAAKNAEYTGYSTPNVGAKQLLPAVVKNNPDFYPSQQTLKKLTVYQDLGLDWTTTYNDLYLEFKMNNHR